MKRLAFNLAAGVCVLLAAAHAAAAKDTWLSVRSQNFFLVGNAGEKDVRRVATRLEQFRDVFTRLFPAAKFTSPVPTTVIVFKSDGSYKPFKPVVDGKISENVAGYFQAGEDVNYITLTTERGAESPYRTIYHEYVHLLVENTLGKAAPPWFNEGLAEYYSTFDVDDDRKVYIGNPVSNHVLLLRQQQLIPLKTFLEVDYHTLHRNKHDAKGLFYAQAWALVHYMILGEEGRRLPQMGKFFDLLVKKVPTEQAFREAFQTDYAGMEKELRTYLRRNSFPIKVATFDQKLEFDQGMQSAPVSEAEAESYLGDLLLHTGRHDEAAGRLRQALALDPELGRAHASLGMAHMRQKRFADARRHLERAVSANAQSYLAHYYYAYTLSREGMDETGRVMGYAEGATAAMRSALLKAIELKPDFPESYHLLAFVNLVNGEQLDESIGLLKRARTLSPGNEQYALVLAQIYLRKENFDAARATVEPLARSASDPQTRADAQSILDAASAMQQQAARLKAMREAESAASDNQPPGDGQEQPRLHRRDGADGAAAGKTEDELVAAAFSESLNEALRKPLEGETRVRGLLARIDCGPKGVVFVVKVGERLLRLQSRDFNDIHIMAFTQEAGSVITCGARKAENAVVVSYRPAKAAGAKIDGDVVAVEFVPAAFELKQ